MESMHLDPVNETMATEDGMPFHRIHSAPVGVHPILHRLSEVLSTSSVLAHPLLVRFLIFVESFHVRCSFNCLISIYDFGHPFCLRLLTIPLSKMQRLLQVKEEASKQEFFRQESVKRLNLARGDLKNTLDACHK